MDPGSEKTGREEHEFSVSSRTLPPPPAAGTARRAVIDVGTNSVKLLVADVGQGGLLPVEETSQQTRLGRGFYETHRLQAGAIAQTAQVVAAFAARARQVQAGTIRVIATSAARDARNQADLCAAIEQASHVAVEVIPGELEAEWAFCGVSTDPALAGQPLLILDAGGGSTEFILGQDGHPRFCHSFALGTVRLLEQFPPADPPTAAELTRNRTFLRDFIASQVLPRLEPHLHTLVHPPLLVGTGGTTTILARIQLQTTEFNRQQLDAVRLSHEQVRHQVEQLWTLPLAARKKILGLPPNRADVILMGVLIFEAVMAQWGFTELRVSTRGLRFAAVSIPPPT